jgi:bifunctional non-homologous end joining protein LigD
MALRQYQKKRKFQRTPEPKGKIGKSGKNRFVVQEHHARNLHWDFRLEMQGVLKSWAIPKGLPEKKGIKRLAVQVEDHPVDYINFKGKIPKGQYGAGIVKIFDKGNYKLINKTKDRISFILKGEKLKGEYHLIKTKFGKNQWLLIRGK